MFPDCCILVDLITGNFLTTDYSVFAAIIEASYDLIIDFVKCHGFYLLSLVVWLFSRFN